MTHLPTVILSRSTSALGALARRVEVPQRVGSVVLIKPLGEGGMGVVHLARHEIFQRNVAVKFLLDIPGSTDDPRFTAFIEGARAAATIKHKGLNLVHHADSIEGIPYLVMELIEGPTLADLLRTHGTPPPNIARALIECICDAVGELHTHAVVHRDIKPANVMIDPAGRVVVTDFGLAVQRPAAHFGAVSAGAIGSLGVAGTPAYMAPEMFDANVSTRTDVYAIGVNMCELLTGKLPFQGDFQQLRFAHRSSSVPVSLLASAGVPEDVIVLIERAMHKDVLFRPKSARHVLDAFSKACDAAGIDRATDLQIQRFVEIGGSATHKPTSPIAASVRATPTPAYYDRLTSLAEQKRRTPDSSHIADPRPDEPPHSTEAIATTHAVSTESPPVEDTPLPSSSPTRSRRTLDHRIALPVFILAGAICLALTSFLGSSARNALVHLYDRLGWIDRSAQGTIAVGGRTIDGALPFLASLSVHATHLAIFLVVPLLALWWSYVHLVLSHPRLDGVTRCGWCASPLARLRDLRCPECGRFFASGAAPSEKPPARRWAVRFAHYGVTAAVFSIVLAAVTPFYLRALTSWAGMSTRPLPFTFAGVAAMFGLVLPAVAASLGTLHTMARSTAALTGRTCCGRCGSDLAGITTPACASCGTRI